VRREIVEDNANSFRLRVVLIDELPHALGEVDARTLIGDLGMAPGLVHVDEHEDVRGAIAYVLVVDACRFARFGTDRNPFFADQLPRGLIEAHDGSQRIWRLSVQIEDVLHAGHVLAVDRRNAPHLLPPRLQVDLRKAAPDRVTRQGFVRREPHHLSGQQLQRPFCAPGRRVRASDRDQECFIGCGELARWT